MYFLVWYFHIEFVSQVKLIQTAQRISALCVTIVSLTGFSYKRTSRYAGQMPISVTPIYFFLKNQTDQDGFGTKNTKQDLLFPPKIKK